MFRKAKEWLDGVYYKRPMQPSYETLVQIHSYMSSNVLVTMNNKLRLVEMYRLMAETIIWGDRNDPRILDYFINNNLLIYFVLHMCQSDQSLVVTYQIFQALNIIFENVHDSLFLNNILSNNCINIILVMTRNETNEEVIALYVSLMKTISFKIDTSNICFLFDAFNIDIPLLSKSILLYDYHESMVRIAVRTITFNILKYHDHPNLNTYLNQKLAVPFFLYLMECITEYLTDIHNKIIDIDKYTCILCASGTEVGGYSPANTIDEGVGKTDHITSSDRLFYKQQITALFNQIDNEWYRIGEHVEYISDLISILSEHLATLLKNIFIEKLIVDICLKNIHLHMIYNFFIIFIFETITDQNLKAQLTQVLLVRNLNFEDISTSTDCHANFNLSDLGPNNLRHSKFSSLVHIIRSHMVWNEQIDRSFENFKAGNVRLKDFIEEINYNFKNNEATLITSITSSVDYQKITDHYANFFQTIDENEFVMNDYLNFLTSIEDKLPISIFMGGQDEIRVGFMQPKILETKFIVMNKLFHEFPINEQLNNTIEDQQKLVFGGIIACEHFVKTFIDNNVIPLPLTVDYSMYLLENSAKFLCERQYNIEQIHSIILNLVTQTYLSLQMIMRECYGFFDAFIISLKFYNKNMYNNVVNIKSSSKQLSHMMLMIANSKSSNDKRIMYMFFSRDMRDRQFYFITLLSKLYLTLETIADNLNIKPLNPKLYDIIHFSVTLPDIDSSIDLTNKEISFCKIIQHNTEKKQFLVVTSESILIVDPDTNDNIGCGIIKRAVSLHDTHVDYVSSDNYSFSIQVINRKSNVRDHIDFHFDDYIRCMLSKQRIERMISSLNESLKESISLLLSPVGENLL